jgi:hypothetical protein
LDCPVVWTKQHDEDGQVGTHSILALIQNETAPNGFPWPLYVQLTTAHQMGDAVGVYVRLNKTGECLCACVCECDPASQREWRTRTHARAHIRTHARTDTHTHTRTHTHTHAHTVLHPTTYALPTGRVDGPGGMKDPWQAAFHTDLGNSAGASGCSIGTNIEITNPSPDVEAIGVNAHMVAGHAYAA